MPIEKHVISTTMFPIPWKNLSATARFLNWCGSLTLAIAPKPKVVTVRKMKPMIIVFFYPNAYFIRELKGAKII